MASSRGNASQVLRSIRPTRAALGVSRANIEAIVYRRSWKHLLSRRGGIGAEIGRRRTGTTGASETDRPTRIGTTGRVPRRSIGWRSRPCSRTRSSVQLDDRRSHPLNLKFASISLSGPRVRGPIFYRRNNVMAWVWCITRVTKRLSIPPLSACLSPPPAPCTPSLNNSGKCVLVFASNPAILSGQSSHAMPIHGRPSTRSAREPLR
jgi:hypothetical protein